MSSRIPLYVSNQRAYVWDTKRKYLINFITRHAFNKLLEDLAILRSEYRVCGLLVGTLPHLSQQNVFLGLPVLLTPEEVVLLVEKGISPLPMSWLLIPILAHRFRRDCG